MLQKRDLANILKVPLEKEKMCLLAVRAKYANKYAYTTPINKRQLFLACVLTGTPYKLPSVQPIPLILALQQQFLNLISWPRVWFTMPLVSYCMHPMEGHTDLVHSLVRLVVYSHSPETSNIFFSSWPIKIFSWLIIQAKDSYGSFYDLLFLTSQKLVS